MVTYMRDTGKCRQPSTRSECILGFMAGYGGADFSVEMISGLFEDISDDVYASLDSPCKRPADEMRELVQRGLVKRVRKGYYRFTDNGREFCIEQFGYDWLMK